MFYFSLIFLSVFLSSCGSSPDQTTSNEVETTAENTASETADKIPSSPEENLAAAIFLNPPAVAPPKTSNEKFALEEEEVLGKELGLARSDLKARADALHHFLTRGLYPRNFCKVSTGSKSISSTDNPEAPVNPERVFCDLISDLESPSGVAVNRVRKRRERRVPVRPNHFDEQQSMEVSRLLKSMSREPAERILAWVPSMLKKQSCPRNLSAASALKLESLLPDLVAKDAIGKLYEHAAACMMVTDTGYERLHLRQALLSYLWGDQEGALLAINRALLSKDPKEYSRVLFWAGFLQKNPLLKKKYWEQLTEEYPMSYHALEVWRDRQVDPYKMVLSRPQIKISREIPESEKMIESHLRWLETLYHFGKIDAAQKMGLWLTREFRDEISVETLLYISSLKSEKNIPLNTIVFLNKEIIANPKFLNEQTLRMLFPKPYFEEFDKATMGIDTFLVMSVARQESGFNPKARSHANARGLLQLLPGTARRLERGRKRPDLYDTETNIRLGVRYLENMVDKLGSVELALAAYNAGPNRIPEWQGRYPTANQMLFMDLIPFQETRDYVSLIVRNNYWYNRLYGQELVAAREANEDERRPSNEKRSALVSELITIHSQGPAATSTRLAEEVRKN